MKKFGIFVALVAGFLFTTNTASAQIFGRGGCGSSCNSGGGRVFHGGGLFHHHGSPTCGSQVVYGQPTYYQPSYTTCSGAPVYYSSGCGGTVIYGTPVYNTPITLPAPSSTYVPPSVGGTRVNPTPAVEPKQPFTLPAPSSKQPPR
jgi:hypothetical protein